MGEVVYGGRVQCFEDQQVILSLLRDVLKIAKDPPQDQSPSESNTINIEMANKSFDGIENQANTKLVKLFPEYIGELEDLVVFAKVMINQFFYNNYEIN